MERQTSDDLTDGETECLRLVHANLPLDEIAGRVGLSVAGVKYRLKSARQKLGANRSDQAARMLFGTTIPDCPPGIAPLKLVPIDGTVSDPTPTAVVDDTEVAVEDHRIAYQAGPPSPHLMSPRPLIGRTFNDLTWAWKLLLGLLCGFLALTSVGAALRLGDALR